MLSCCRAVCDSVCESVGCIGLFAVSVKSVFELNPGYGALWRSNLSYFQNLLLFFTLVDIFFVVDVNRVEVCIQTELARNDKKKIHSNLCLQSKTDKHTLVPCVQLASITCISPFLKPKNSSDVVLLLSKVKQLCI